MSPTEALPLLVVVLLLVSVNGGAVDQMAIHFEGDHAVESMGDALVVAGGTTTVPAAESVAGDVYVIGGNARVEGRVDGDVTVLAGNLSVTAGATVTGTVQTIGGASTIAEGATVGRTSTFDPPTPDDSPARRIGGFVLQFIVLGVAGFWLARRHPSLLGNVGHSITEHALVSGVVGALAGLSLLVLFVYMAFTLLLLPVTVIGLVGEVLVVLYGQIVFGWLIGTRLPVDRPGLATVIGIGAFLLVTELLGVIPYLGVLVQFGLVAVGFGAVVNSYFGLQRFEPATIPGSVG